ncbi:hypothetical protein HCG51_10405 [Tolypothrix sp. PCC 7910]|uniref:hypothetical protein n=1 Tax=Tolypothrix sp. PCC 7910 TaxID=2099387 RepID=UPI000D205A5B|nr:hypothetical protein [Tolypothrix sp. PCC 7910]AVH79442.1 hypothetical protein [Tolypothrix sp. PCC 7910]QIR37101.1 hypothetical protein HCG51_10405 [Tolypothrix sp. PCC 7910]
MNDSSINSLPKTDVDQSPADLDSPAPLLPRLAWNSQIAYMRVVFKAKKALDRIEQEAGTLGKY